MPSAMLVVGRLAIMEYEANRLDSANQYIEQCLAFSLEFGLDDILAFAYGVSAQICFAQGNLHLALERLGKAKSMATQQMVSDSSWLNGWEITVRLRQGDLQSAVQLVEAANLSTETALTYLNIQEHLAYARLLLAQDDLEAARQVLSCLEKFASESQLYRRLISTHLLQAVLAERSGARTQAVDYLARALRLAVHQDYVRAFLDEGEGVLALLPRVRHIALVFIDTVLNAARGDYQQQNVQQQPLDDPLSEREIEVLNLITSGLSNAEIAERLVITLGTVKRHINHIYDKLDVGSRTQAVLRARELHLVNLE